MAGVREEAPRRGLDTLDYCRRKGVSQCSPLPARQPTLVTRAPAMERVARAADMLSVCGVEVGGGRTVGEAK